MGHPNVCKPVGWELINITCLNLYVDSKANLARIYEFVVRIGTQVWFLLIHPLVFNSDLLSV